jgi:tetratricopeptide (TPR) repeat protein
VDLDSQNGIWVLGTRVPSVPLEPGVVAAVGPYRLTIETAANVPIDNVTTTETEFIPRAAAPRESVPVSGAGDLLNAPAPPAAAPPAAAVPRPSTPAAKAPAPPTPSAKTPGPSAAGSKPATSAKPLTLGLAAAAVLLVGIAAFAAYRWTHRPPKPVWDRDVAVALVNAGNCPQALAEQITPALNANPQDAEALALKDKCTAPPPPPPPAPTSSAPPEKTPTEKLDEAEAAIAANDCQAALDEINGVLAGTPDDPRAKDLAARADACLHPAPAAPADPAAVRIAPAEGGLDVNSGERQRDYVRRVQAMRKRYDDAVALLKAQKYQQALKEFDDIASAVPAGYVDLAQRRAEARNAIHDEANRAYAAGEQAEQHGDWNTAIQRYQRAHDIDARDISADLARITETKTRQGREACAKGNAAFTLGRNGEAATQYELVVQLLPESDACYATAKQRLATIRR